MADFQAQQRHFDAWLLYGKAMEAEVNVELRQGRAVTAAVPWRGISQNESE